MIIKHRGFTEDEFALLVHAVDHYLDYWKSMPEGFSDVGFNKADVLSTLEKMMKDLLDYYVYKNGGLTSPHFFVIIYTRAVPALAKSGISVDDTGTIVELVPLFQKRSFSA